MKYFEKREFSYFNWAKAPNHKLRLPGWTN